MKKTNSVFEKSREDGPEFPVMHLYSRRIALTVITVAGRG